MSDPKKHSSNELHLAFEWLRVLATQEGAPPEAGVAFDEWHRLASNFLPAAPTDPYAAPTAIAALAAPVPPAQEQPVREVLAELVACSDESAALTKAAVYDERWTALKERSNAAWAAARAVLTAPAPQVLPAKSENVVAAVAELGSECYARCATLQSALAELVALKAIKTHIEQYAREKQKSPALLQMELDYAARKPVAWERASAALQGATAPSSQPPAPSWQPIETAPKDGTPVLLISVSAQTPEPDIGHWSDEDGFFRGGYPDDWASMSQRGLKTWFDLSSHWMPLPSAPSTEGAAG